MPDGQQPATVGDDGSERRADGPAGGAPAISLPKGGGAVHGIGEKFSANPVTGTGSLTVPIATSPGRSGFGPALALSYDSGAGNGPFGLGWSLSLPSITRRTDRGLPQYQDAIESDIFVLSGAEDLVRTLSQDSKREAAAIRDGYAVTQYRPRIEGLFARIERWTRLTDGDTYWRSISKANVTTFYGKTSESRITDPNDPLKVFSWLICESRDDKGNAIVYSYVAEDSAKVDLSQANEQNRTQESRSANRYLKRVRYGNTISALKQPDLTQQQWLFEVVFDYGEGHYTELTTDTEGRQFVTAAIAGTNPWPRRQDPFSKYRSAFEVRTYRLCQRVLMFHHFQEELGVADYLVRATELDYQSSPIASFVASVTQSGFVRQSNGSFLRRSLPALELEYSTATVQQTVQDVDSQSLENLPAGVDGLRYRWLDLDGEGTQGVLAEYNDAWYYKRNLSPLTFHFEDEQPKSIAQFEPMAEVAKLPGYAKAKTARRQFLDLAGDGQLDCVVLERPLTGFYKRTEDEDWESFSPLRSTPNVNWSDPNLRFIDVNGDGHADVLITEDDAFTWYPSLAEDGFGGGIRVPKSRNEEQGPAIIFSDSTESIFLGDMSGDGLTDIVRIRNGEICYWPNLGYGHFGPKVSMDGAPWFDAPDLFDPRRIRLADVDGSGTIDIIYLGSDGVRLFFNQAGNAWSPEQAVIPFPKVDRLSAVQAVDLLGNGTACLVWTSPLPADARQVMRYVDLMGGQKPYLLTKSLNNLGAETRIQYAPSTKFYLKAKREGRPWLTRLAFPVQVVERVETYDAISRNRFVSRYAYHHGYFDGIEREFRGFGYVEQIDTEELGVLTASGALGSADNIDAQSYVPPVQTKTWFHTGAYPRGEQISRAFEAEYYQEKDPTPNATQLPADALRAMQLPDTLLPPDIGVYEVREAIRALKGSMLRQEVYALDGTEAQTRPYSVSEQNYTIELVQSFGENRHAVFFTHARESINFHYERKLYNIGLKKPTQRRADPRVTHSMILKVDPYGNVERSASIAYGRRYADPDPFLSDWDHAVQMSPQVTYTESAFTSTNTNTKPILLTPDAYRLPLPCEARTYELGAGLPKSNIAQITNLFGFGEVTDLIESSTEVAYEEAVTTGKRRLIEHVRTLYRKDDLSAGLLLGGIDPLALPFQSYKLAFTPGRLKLFQRAGQDLIPNLAEVLGSEGGYVSGKDAKTANLFPSTDADDVWWIPSGQTFLAPATSASEISEARAHFFLPRRFRDPFGNEANVAYDDHDLLVRETVDAIGNTVTVGERASDGTSSNGNDYRVLQPAAVTDPNGNRSKVAFDALGLVVGTAVMGKLSDSPQVGDVLDSNFVADLPQTAIARFLQDPKGQAAALLGTATSRIVYDVNRFQPLAATPAPSFAATIVRETHVSDTPITGPASKLQVSFSYGDGFGREIQRKIQAEPGPVNGVDVNPRWVGSGWTIFNNKGKPVRKYEPFFSTTFDFEFGVMVGVSPILFYDPVGRVVATMNPDKTWQKVIFDPWRQETWDANDTVKLDPAADEDIRAYVTRLPANDYAPTWYITNSTGSAEQQDAAAKALAHHATPTVVYADSLGRAFLTVAFNLDGTGAAEKYPTRVLFDIEGKKLEVRDANFAQDAQGKLVLDSNGAKVSVERAVMRYDYNLLGTRIHQASMEAGERWTLNDVIGKPIRAWSSRLYDFRTQYDPLRRAVRSFVVGGDAFAATSVKDEVFAAEALFARTLYGEQHPDAVALNLRGRVFMQFDSAGVVTSGGKNPNTTKDEAFDFKGNLLRASRALVARDPVTAVVAYKATLNWQTLDALLPADFSQPLTATTLSNLETQIAALLDDPPFVSSGTFDALNRSLTTTSPDGSVSQPRYNEANLLESLSVSVRGASPTTFVQNIDYNARGQRTHIECGQKSDGSPVAVTDYAYDLLTFRLQSLTTTRGGAPPQDFATQLFKDPETLQALSYTYDSIGNITRIADAALIKTESQIDASSSYTYDAMYRLIEAEGREHIGQCQLDQLGSAPTLRDYPFLGPSAPNANDLQALQTYIERYNYDIAGNILQMKHQAGNSVSWTRAYQYAQASYVDTNVNSNQLSNTTLQPGGSQAVKEPYTYDAHGNMASMAHLPVMGWDFKDQLRVSGRQVVNDGVGERTYYVYDGSGRRIRKVTGRAGGARKNERVYLGGWEIYREYDTNGTTVTLKRETLHVADGARNVAFVETKTVDGTGSGGGAALNSPVMRYQFDNHLGSASLELGNDGALISYEEYLPYGATSFQAAGGAAEGSAKRYRYTGMERDEETGLGYHTARYYAGWLGRWTACDPLAGANSYDYCKSRPISRVDLDGCEPWSIVDEDEKLHLVSGSELLDSLKGIWNAVVGAASSTAELAGAMSPMYGLPDVPDEAQVSDTLIAPVVTKTTFKNVSDEGKIKGQAVVLVAGPLIGRMWPELGFSADLGALDPLAASPRAGSAPALLPLVETSAVEAPVAETSSNIPSVVQTTNEAGLQQTAQLQSTLKAAGLEVDLAAPSASTPSAGPLAGATDAAKDLEKGGSLIYRSASGTPSSMTPRPVDTKGLSAANSLANALPGKNQIIDTSKFTSLCAICDNPATGHVSIKPKDMRVMQSWIESRVSTAIHPLTQELMDSVVGTVKK